MRIPTRPRRMTFCPGPWFPAAHRRCRSRRNSGCCLKWRQKGPVEHQRNWGWRGSGHGQASSGRGGGKRSGEAAFKLIAAQPAGSSASAANLNPVSHQQPGEEGKEQKLMPPPTTKTKAEVDAVRAGDVAIGAPRREGAVEPRATPQPTVCALRAGIRSPRVSPGR